MSIETPTASPFFPLASPEAPIDTGRYGWRWCRPFSAEPAGEEDGEPLYKLDFGGEDAEGHGRRFSDARLKRDVRPL